MFDFIGWLVVWGAVILYSFRAPREVWWDFLSEWRYWVAFIMIIIGKEIWLRVDRRMNKPKYPT